MSEEHPKKKVLYIVRSERLAPGTVDTKICTTREEMRTTYESMRKNPTRTNTNSLRVSDMTDVTADVERELMSDE